MDEDEEGGVGHSKNGGGFFLSLVTATTPTHLGQLVSTTSRTGSWAVGAGRTHWTLGEDYPSDSWQQETKCR